MQDKYFLQKVYCKGVLDGFLLCSLHKKKTEPITEPIISIAQQRQKAREYAIAKFGFVEKKGKLTLRGKK